MTLQRDVIDRLLDSGIDELHRDDQKDHDQDEAPLDGRQRQKQSDDDRHGSQHTLKGDAGILPDPCPKSGKRITELMDQLIF